MNTITDMDNNIDIEKAKIDFEYFYNNFLLFQDKDGNMIAPPPLKDYQKAFINWMQEAKKNGVDVIYINSTRYKL